MTIDEDKKFLLAQRKKGRQGYMAGVDQQLALEEERKTERENEIIRRRRKTDDEKKKLTETVELLSDSSAEDSEKVSTRKRCRVDSDFEPTPGQSDQADVSKVPKKRGRKIVIDEELAATLDRTNVSNRKATFIVAHTAKSLGCNIGEMALNEKSVRTARAKLRKSGAERILSSFSADVPLVVHWDGKLLPELTGRKKVDRLPI
ncbi:unnamed protein product [Bemisia tabaci]|uniref:Uncharacterized protein n=1 Tax=Bemisia tabaci TaxID=7038 RepID=A0A9P0EW83_BEMTA|nr:unnamed protein product [Bemisia tabaci]